MNATRASKARLGVSAIALLAALAPSAQAQDETPNLINYLQQRGQTPSINSLEMTHDWDSDKGEPIPMFSTMTASGSIDWDSDKGEPIPMFSTMTASGSIDWDSDKGEPAPMFTTPANPGEHFNLVDFLLLRGHEVTIQNIIPMMNWRYNLGSPVGQIDATNTRPSVGMINMVRSDTSASMGFCSGTLINARFFLTAAHCVRSFDRRGLHRPLE
jgi:V8-like Glu-specific endopeptidase